MSLTSIARAVYQHLRPARTYPPTMCVYDVARDKASNETVSKRTLIGMQTLANVRYHLPSRPDNLSSFAFTAPEDVRYSLYDAHHDLCEAVEVVSGYRAGSQAREAMSETLVSLHNKVDLAHDCWSQMFWDHFDVSSFDVGSDLMQQNAHVRLAGKWLGGVPRLERLPADIEKLTLRAYVTLMLEDGQITAQTLRTLETLFSRISGIPVVDGEVCTEHRDVASMPQPEQIRSIQVVREDLLAAFKVAEVAGPCKEIEALKTTLRLLGDALKSPTPPPVPRKPSGLSDVFGEMEAASATAGEDRDRIVEAIHPSAHAPHERAVAEIRAENGVLRTQVKQLRDVLSRLQGDEDKRNAPPASLVLSEARVHAKL